MVNFTPLKGPTRPERSQYWLGVRRETWDLSRDQFQRHHEIIVAAIALLIRLYFLGWEEMMSELLTSLFYVAVPVVLYLVGLYVVNFIRAMIRVSVYRQREVDKLTNEIVQIKAPRLQFEFPDAELDRSTPNSLVVFVRVKNLTALTIENVSVRIASIIKIDEPEHSDFARVLKTLIGLPLMIRSGGPLLPEGELPQRVTIDGGGEALFNVLLLEHPYPHLLHAIRSQSPRLANGTGGAWAPFPPMELRPGRYHLQLRTQGKDTPPEMLTIEFFHVFERREARQIRSLPSLP